MGVACINLPFNMGLAAAFKTGIKFAKENDYDIAIQFDADGQHIAEYINDLQKMVNAGCDIAIGSRSELHRAKLSERQIGALIIRGGIKLTTGKTILDPTSGMRAYSKRK